MALLRWKYDLMYGGPHVLGTEDWDGDQLASPDAIVLNIGTTASPIDSTVSGNIVNIRASFTNTSGDARNIYNRMYLEGTAGGDAMRVFTTVNNNLDNARGAHISLNFEATAGGSECTGTGTPLTTTLHIPNVAAWAPTGTLYGAQIQIYSDGTNSDPAGLTTLACLSIENAGHATGMADVDTDAFLLNLGGWTAGSGKLFDTGHTGTTVVGNMTASLKIKVGATTYYIPLATALT